MTIRPLVILPDARLRQVSTPVGTIDDEVRTLAADMLETMYDAPGVGLAAIQVGVTKRLVTIDTSKDENARQPQVFIDPEIVWASEEKRVYDEGCLSIPEYYGEVERPDRVRVRFATFPVKPARSRRTGFWPPASSTRSITSTAYSSSITCRS